MNKDEVQSLYCQISNYVSAVEDIDFIDSWRAVKYEDEYLKLAPRLLKLLEELEDD